VTITNTGFSTIPAGTLEITFPAVLSVSAPTAVTFVNNVATWDVPTLPPNATHTVQFTVTGTQNAQDIATQIKYLVNNSQLAFTAGIEDIGAVLGVTTPPPAQEGEAASAAGGVPSAEQPAVAGAALPRTGASFLGTLAIILGLMASLRFERKAFHQTF